MVSFTRGLIYTNWVVGTLKSTRGSQVSIYRMKNRRQRETSETRTRDEGGKAEWILGRDKGVIVRILVVVVVATRCGSAGGIVRSMSPSN